MGATVYNFSAGPGAMPAEVLSEVQAELHDWHSSGLSVPEMGHRSDEFREIAHNAEQDLRDLLDISDDYSVLFLQGGATGQFAAVPFNLAPNYGSADYVVNGIWGEKAVKEAKKFLGLAGIAAKAELYTYVPSETDWQLREHASYVHITTNETINGVQFHEMPKISNTLVADKSSDILSEPIDIDGYGVIYAGAQKNIGPAGMAVVIVRNELLEAEHQEVASIWDWKAQAEAGSMLNTPPTVSWYMAGLVFKWLKEQGGLEVMDTVNQRKSQKLYEAIDSSNLYSNPVWPEYRSRMNVPFSLGEVSLESVFLKEAEKAGLTNLRGHRSVGGLRASIYNAMPEEGVDALVFFMKDFERRH